MKNTLVLIAVLLIGCSAAATWSERSSKVRVQVRNDGATSVRIYAITALGSKIYITINITESP
jgi:hypothetical protein